MSPIDFNAWAKAIGWNNSEIARKLHLARGTVIRYRVHGAPHHIGLAAAALSAGLEPWQARRARLAAVDAPFSFG